MALGAIFKYEDSSAHKSELIKQRLKDENLSNDAKRIYNRELARVFNQSRQ